MSDTFDQMAAEHRHAEYYPVCALGINGVGIGRGCGEQGAAVKLHRVGDAVGVVEFASEFVDVARVLSCDAVSGQQTPEPDTYSFAAPVSDRMPSTIMPMARPIHELLPTPAPVVSSRPFAVRMSRSARNQVV